MRRHRSSGFLLACVAGSAAADGLPPAGTYAFTFENDIFAGTDEGYTNGVRLSYRSDEGDLPLWGRALRGGLEPVVGERSWSVAYALGHEIYTPDDITLRVPEPDDRPYAGFLFVSFGLAARGERAADALTLDLGVVGESSLAEEIQSFVHEVVEAEDPRGWDTQVRDEPGFRLGWRRGWAPLAGTSLSGIDADLAPVTEISLGNVDTSAAAGLVARLGPGLPAVPDPIEPGPVEPGAGLDWRLYASAEARVVGYDLFLQGNALRDGVEGVAPSRLVGTFALGAEIGHGPVALGYRHVLRSRQYEAQDGPAQFGSLTLRLRL